MNIYCIATKQELSYNAKTVPKRIPVYRLHIKFIARFGVLYSKPLAIPVAVADTGNLSSQYPSKALSLFFIQLSLTCSETPNFFVR